MQNKRGVSPLIATVILVAISIAMAATISTYFLKQAKEFNPEEIVEGGILCESVTLGFDVGEGFSISSSNPSSIGPLVLINRGSFSIYQLVITAPGFKSRNLNVLELDPTGNSDNPEIDSNGGYILGAILPSDDTDTGRNDNEYPLTLQIRDNEANREIKIVPVICDVEKSEGCTDQNKRVLVTCPNRQLVINYEELCERLTTTNGDPCPTIDTETST